jgi:cephalosporin hydroxylase
MTPLEQFKLDRISRVESYKKDIDFYNLSQIWLRESMQKQYVYNFDWLGRPIIQYPQDMVAIQEVIWRTKPDLIIETGIAHGGSLILSASILALLDMSEAIQRGGSWSPQQSRRLVVGVDIDIRPHNRELIESHPMSSRIKMIEGSSISSETIEQIKLISKNFNKIMVILDSNHTHDHVLAELTAYAPLVTKDNYCVVLDTFVDDMPPKFFQDRPWDVGDNPKTAVKQYLHSNPSFIIDTNIQDYLQITVAPEGYLRRLG